jgi:hypothetical protein
MDYALGLQWMAMAIMFLISSIWSERNVRYGYILAPFMVGFFWAIGWIQFPYLATVIPMIIMIGILAYLRSHLRIKFGVFGSSGGLLFKIVVFVIFLQFALIFVNGLVSAGVFDQQFAPNPSNQFNQYTITEAQGVYSSSTTDIGITDAVWNGLGLIWSQWAILWKMVFGFFNIYGTMTSIFHVPMAISVILSAGIYILTAIEVFVLIFKPFRAPEV